jgi:hypothetical protein
MPHINFPTNNQLPYESNYGEIDKLTGSNYLQWRTSMRFMLQAENCLNITLGEEQQLHARRTAATADYNKRLGMGSAMIINSCTEEVQQDICHLNNPVEMWEELFSKPKRRG